MDSKQLDDIVLAVLFASDEALTIKRIESVLDDVSSQEIRDALKRLEASFGTEESVIRLEKVAGGHQLSTSPRFSEYVARLYRGRRKQRLSKAAMETLAIIAYKQPATRADIENIRGVGCGGVVTTLMERCLIRIVGKARVLGSPFLYGTTQEFLEYLGLNSLRDLPSLEDLEALLAEGAEAETNDENGDRPVASTGETRESEDSDDGFGIETVPDAVFEEPISDVQLEEKREDGLDEEEAKPALNEPDEPVSQPNVEENNVEPQQTKEIESADDIVVNQKEPGRE